MKRKTRDIVVRDLKFGYGVTVEDCPWPGRVKVVLWARQTNPRQKMEIRFPNDLQPVTPSVIRLMIEWAIDRGWTSGDSDHTLSHEWSSRTPPTSEAALVVDAANR